VSSPNRRPDHPWRIPGQPDLGWLVAAELFGSRTEPFIEGPGTPLGECSVRLVALRFQCLVQLLVEHLAQLIALLCGGLLSVPTRCAVAKNIELSGYRLGSACLRGAAIHAATTIGSRTAVPDAPPPACPALDRCVWGGADVASVIMCAVRS
jgi:hypothetical protein